MIYKCMVGLRRKNVQISLYCDDIDWRYNQPSFKPPARLCVEQLVLYFTQVLLRRLSLMSEPLKPFEAFLHISYCKLDLFM